MLMEHPIDSDIMCTHTYREEVNRRMNSWTHLLICRQSHIHAQCAHIHVFGKHSTYYTSDPEPSE